MEVRELLLKVKSGEIDLVQAEDLLKQLPYEDLGFAKLDHHRAFRSGFGEVIYCQGKTIEQTVHIFKSFAQKNSDVMGTRASIEQYRAVKEVLPEVAFDEVSRVLTYQKNKLNKIGNIAVCTGGTSDIAVAEEAVKTAEFFGSKVERYYDIGVAGIHRLFAKLTKIQEANCIIAVAGMEGALGGVIAGLVDIPVICVPTSVGYGANFGGVAALLTMLNSCAEGITVVNIDNGFGAGYTATQINRLACNGKVS